MSELKPCPFCGGRRARTIHIRDGRKVACLCGACGKPAFLGPEELPNAEARAIAAWNTRDNIESLEQRVTALREALGRQCDNMAFALNNFSMPDQWYAKLSRELEQDRTALQNDGEGV